MATATGDIVLDYSGLADTNPYVHDSGVYTENGPGFLITGGALKAISGFSFVNITDAPSGDSFSIEIEVATVSNNDPIYITALDASGNGYGFSLLSSTASYLYKITGFALDGSGITPNAGGHAIGDNFLMTVDKAAGSISVSRNGAAATVYSGLVDYMSATLRPGISYARNNVGSSGFSSWGATGYAVSATGTIANTLPAITQTAAGVVGSAAVDAPLQYGAAFTGTYSGLSPTNPDDLVVSDGTRSMTVSTAVNTGAGTFGDTFTALPAAPGDLPAGSAVFPGSVTATFEGVGISTTLSVPTGYANFIVGASPDYTAFDASGWAEADRPVTGECVIYDTRGGDVTIYDDLTLDAEIEDDDIYLAVIRADGSVDSGFIDTTGVPVAGSSGAAASTLPAMAQASVGDSSQTAAVAQVLPLPTQSMSGFTGLGGVLAQTLPSLIQEMTGGIDTGGGISQTLPSISQSADGTSAAVNDGSQTETFNVVYRRRRRA